MTRLSDFEKAAVHVERLRRMRKFRSYYETFGDVECSFDTAGKPAPITLSKAGREDFSRALVAEEKATLDQLRAYDVKIDEDLP
jgi:hypothetical protein